MDFVFTPDDIKDIAHDLSGGQSYDIILIGDGSGTVVGKPCGWCCYHLDCSTNRVFRHKGGVSSGTNNLAELLPYAHALWQDASGVRPMTSRKTHVAIISDSELTVRCGTGQYERRANASLWASIAWFEDNGYAIDWWHIPRNTNAVSKACDALAGLMRISMMEPSLA